jgi:hypothetical protein
MVVHDLRKIRGFRLISISSSLESANMHYYEESYRGAVNYQSEFTLIDWVPFSVITTCFSPNVFVCYSISLYSPPIHSFHVYIVVITELWSETLPLFSSSLV